MRIATLLGLTFALSACGLPNWWPEALGGRVRHDRLVAGPLREPSIGPALLPPLGTLGPDGLRVTIAPSFSDFDYALDLVPQPLNCYFHPGEDFDQERSAREGCRFVEARYTIVLHGERAPAVARRFRFRIPEQEFREAVSGFDRLAPRWRGGDSASLDGTTIGIEQLRAGAPRSMKVNGNLSRSPNNPALWIMPQIHRMLLAYGPAGWVPVDPSFIVADIPDRPCLPMHFNSPDPDGLGAGDDACARAMAAEARSGR